MPGFFEQLNPFVDNEPEEGEEAQQYNGIADAIRDYNVAHNQEMQRRLEQQREEQRRARAQRMQQEMDRRLREIMEDQDEPEVEEYEHEEIDDQPIHMNDQRGRHREPEEAEINYIDFNDGRPLYKRKRNLSEYDKDKNKLDI